MSFGIVKDTMAEAEQELARQFVEFSRQKLINEFWERTCKCLDSLSEEQIWWRPNEASNSIGNLLLHLNGNVRQWIVASLGGKPNRRDRDAEFAERTQIPSRELRSALDETLRDVEEIFDRITPEDLLKTHTIQRFEQVTGMQAIYHVVEHFGMHYGQVLYITKMIQGEDLGFYRHLSGWGVHPSSHSK